MWPGTVPAPAPSAVLSTLCHKAFLPSPERGGEPGKFSSRKEELGGWALCLAGFWFLSKCERTQGAVSTMPHPQSPVCTRRTGLLAGAERGAGPCPVLLSPSPRRMVQEQCCHSQLEELHCTTGINLANEQYSCSTPPGDNTSLEAMFVKVRTRL